tara:strand:- start:418 stop:972 length:555 start_codon:yes stop_codon:yes gene_type:complete
MIINSNTEVKDFIKVYENILDLDDCKKIIEKSKEEKFPRAGIGSYGKKSKTRNCYAKPLNKEFDGLIFNAVGKVLSLYGKEFHFAFSQMGEDVIDTGYDHLLYKGEEKGEFVTHVDHMNEQPRKISISILLNDDFDGGDFYFFDEYIVKNKAGGAVVFPSNFMFPHAVLPVLNGDRHAIITWIL